MYKVLVVDDEYFIRNGLKKIISRYKNYNVVAVAGEGIEALKFIEEMKPDIVISDIKMPKMDGIELVSILNTDYPKIEKIILSGFDEFEYVRNTLKNGAYDYILKPVDEKELIGTLDNIAKKINRNKDYIYDFKCSDLEDGKEVNSNTIESIVLKNINLSDVDIIKILKNEKIDYILDRDIINQIIVVKFDNYGTIKREFGIYEAKLDIFIIKNILDETIESFCKKISFINRDKVIIIIPYLEQHLNELRKRISDNLYKYFKNKTSISIGPKIKGFKKLNKCYKEALNILNDSVINLNEDIEFENFKKDNKNEKRISNKEIYILIEKYNRKFINQIEIADSDTINKFIDDIFLKAYELKLERYEIIKIFNSIYTLLLVNLHLLDDWVNDLYGVNFSFNNTLNIYYELDDMKFFLKDFYYKVIGKSNKYRNRRNIKLIEIVKNYIEKNYSENLTLNKIAEITYLNPNYFCEYFKEETKQTFIDYLTNVRINKAKELLKDVRIKVYEVSDFVGYNDSAYFCRVFKKIVGVTPSQYRERL